MALTDLTCYYYSIFILAAVLTAARRSIGVALLATGGASVVLLGKSIGYADLGFSGFYYVDDNFNAQSYLFFLFGLLMLWGYSRPFSLAAVKAWYAKRPSTRPSTGAAGGAAEDESEPAGGVT
jgi:hypothetical protein